MKKSTPKNKRVTTPLGTGVLTGNENLTRNGRDWIRREVKLDIRPKYFDTRNLWFFKKEITT